MIVTFGFLFGAMVTDLKWGLSLKEKVFGHLSLFFS
jgi:vacuolar-type H+-ATPase subunit I/STV1